MQRMSVKGRPDPLSHVCAFVIINTCLITLPRERGSGLIHWCSGWLHFLVHNTEGEPPNLKVRFITWSVGCTNPSSCVFFQYNITLHMHRYTVHIVYIFAYLLHLCVQTK